MAVAVEDALQIVTIIRRYMAYGEDDPARISRLLEKDHGIIRATATVSTYIQGIKEGKYSTSYYDNLLDIHFPDLYTDVLTSLQHDLADLNTMATNAEDEKTRLAARKAHAALNIDMLNAVHKGPVIRMMKQLATKSKVLAREVIQQEAIIRDGTKKKALVEAQVVHKQFIEFDDNLEVVTTENGKLDTDANSIKGNS